jgi:hypothetical protein
VTRVLSKRATTCVPSKVRRNSPIDECCTARSYGATNVTTQCDVTPNTTRKLNDAANTNTEHKYTHEQRRTTNTNTNAVSFTDTIHQSIPITNGMVPSYDAAHASRHKPMEEQQPPMSIRTNASNGIQQTKVTRTPPKQHTRTVCQRHYSFCLSFL